MGHSWMSIQIGWWDAGKQCRGNVPECPCWWQIECVRAGRRASCVLGCIRHCLPVRGHIFPFCSVLGQPHLKCWGAVLGPTVYEGYKFVRVHPKEGYEENEESWGKMIWGAPGWFSLEEILSVYSCLTQGGGGADADLSSIVTSDSTWGNCLKFCQAKFRLDIKKKFFNWRVVEYWNRFPREVAIAPILTEFKKYLGNALGHMLWFLGLSCAKPGTGLDDFVLPFQFRIFYDPMRLCCCFFSLEYHK